PARRPAGPPAGQPGGPTARWPEGSGVDDATVRRPEGSVIRRLRGIVAAIAAGVTVLIVPPASACLLTARISVDAGDDRPGDRGRRGALRPLLDRHQCQAPTGLTALAGRAGCFRCPGWRRSPAGLAAALAAREERAADRGVCAAGIRRRAKFGQPPPCAHRNRPERRQRTGPGH